jgi:hypothetical protein
VLIWNIEVRDMAKLEGRRWTGDLSGPTLSDRSPCTYEVYLPGRRFTLDGDVASDVSGAESALARLDASAAALANSEALARLFLCAESVASSRIEGLEIGGRCLLRADAARDIRREPCIMICRECNPPPRHALRGLALPVLPGGLRRGL